MTIRCTDDRGAGYLLHMVTGTCYYDDGRVVELPPHVVRPSLLNEPLRGAETPTCRKVNTVVTRRKEGPRGRYKIIDEQECPVPYNGKTWAFIADAERALNAGFLADQIEAIAARLGQHNRPIFRVSLEKRNHSNPITT